MDASSETVQCRDHNKPQSLYCFHCWAKMCTECYNVHQRGHDIRYMSEAQRLLEGLNLQAAGPSQEVPPRCLFMDEPCPIRYHQECPWMVYCDACGLKACLYCYRAVFPEDYMSRAFGALGFYCQEAMEDNDDLDTTTDSEGYGTYDEEDDN